MDATSRLLSIVKCARGEGDDSRRHRRAGGQMPRERFVPATSRALKGHQPNARHASGLLYVGKPWSKARSSIDPFFFLYSHVMGLASAGAEPHDLGFLLSLDSPARRRRS